MKTFKIFTSVIAVGLFSASFAQAKVQVALGGMGVMTQYDYTGTPTSTQGGMGFGGMLLFNYQLKKSKKISFETGAMYLNRAFTDTDTSGVETSRSVASVVVPLTAWLNMGKKTQVSLGVGPYFNKALEYDGYVGVQGQLRVAFGKKANFKWFVGAQYLNGLQEDEVGIPHTDILLQLGLRFGK